MICIYQKGNTDYTKNGDAVLNPTSAMLTMTINGAWQLTIEHPYDAEGKFEYLVEDAVVRADVLCINELETVQQRFRIYNYVRNLHSVTAIAFPIAMESTYDAPVDNIILQNATGQQAMAALQQKTNKYTLSTDITAVASTSWANTNVNSAIAGSSDNTFLKVWGGEILYDNLKYKVRSRLGSNVAADHKVTYGNNLESIEYKKDDSGLITRIYPISKDGIRLNGTGYVDSPHISDYAVPHARYMEAPYSLISTSADDPSSTAQLTRQAISAVNSAASSLSQSVYATAKGNGYQPEYIKTIRSEIVSAVQTMTLQNVISTSLYNAMASTIASAMDWMKDLKQPKWGWMGSDQSGWKYGDATSYAKNMYVKIGKTWSYFGNDGNWQEPKDSSDEWDWHDAKNGNGKQYGNFKKYYAHNEYVYITQSGTIKEYWFNEQGWFEEDESGDSDYYWHGSGTGADPYWFGASSSDYLKSCWRFIDGTYYFFDSYGYVAAQKDNYRWDWVENGDSSRAWFGNAEDSEYAADYLTSQWEKINGTWYYFDASGIVESESVSQTKAVALFTTGMASLTSTVDNWKGQLYTLLYNLMRSYCAYQYRQGVDIPSITISVNMVELSQTTEYEGYEHLETIKLGDSVQCDDYQHSISTINRIVGITYDCIYKKIATVVLGEASATVQQMVGNANGQAVAGGFDTSALETQLTALRNSKQDKLTAGDNIEIINNVISATGGGGQGLRYFVETQNSLYGRSETDITIDPAFVFEGQAGLHARFQGGMNTLLSMDSGVVIGWYESQFIKELRNDTVWNGIFLITDDINKARLYYKFEKENWWDVDSEGTMTYDNAPNASLYPCTSNLSMYGFSSSVEIEGVTYYLLIIASNWLPIGDVKQRDDRKQLSSCLNYMNPYQYGTYTETDPEHGYYVTFADWIRTMLGSSLRIYYNGLSRSGKLAFFAGGEDENGTDAPIKIYADGTAEGLVTKHDFDNADFTGATSSENGAHGLVPQPLIADKNKFLKGDGTWAEETDAIEDLTDVELDNLSDGQILKYNSTSQKWENANESGGSDVEANPSDPATDTLNTIGIDGTVYNIAGGGGGNALILDAQIYSEDEQVVGVWIDGKPLYQKTIVLSSEITVSNRDWTSVGITASSLDIETYVECTAQNSGGTCWDAINVATIDGNISLTAWRNGDTIGVKKFTIKYTKQSDTASSGGYQAYGFSPVIYSTEEREIGVWTNNKPLYEKTIYIGSLTRDSSWHPTAHGISNIEKVVEVYGQTKQSTDGRNYSIPHYRPSNNEGISVGADTTNVYYMDTWLEYASDTYVTVRYTKTTDTAGSGSYNTLGVPMVHYTTDEQVIGTYTDENGVTKPVYQKTQIGGISLTSLGVWYDTLFTNIDQVLDVKGTILRDDEQVNLGYFTNAIGTCWICRDNNIKIQLTARQSGETYALDKLTVQYTKTTD